MWLHIDSRNISSEGILTLQEPIKNITKCSVYMAHFPIVQNERFIFIDIVELRSDQMVDTSSDSFNVNKFVGAVPADGSLYKPSRPMWAVYQTPLDNIFKLTVRITDYLGNVIDLGGEYSVILEVITSPPPQESPEEEEETPAPSQNKWKVGHIIGIGVFMLIVVMLMPFRRHHKQPSAS